MVRVVRAKDGKELFHIDAGSYIPGSIAVDGKYAFNIKFYVLKITFIVNFEEVIFRLIFLPIKDYTFNFGICQTPPHSIYY